MEFQNLFFAINKFFYVRIWTCFEHVLVENNDMLRDRHIDQLLMCAVYVMSKVTKQDKSFHDIMKFYRTQPQATSEVIFHYDTYHKLLILSKSKNFLLHVIFL